MPLWYLTHCRVEDAADCIPVSSHAALPWTCGGLLVKYTLGLFLFDSAADRLGLALGPCFRHRPTAVGNSAGTWNNDNTNHDDSTLGSATVFFFLFFWIEDLPRKEITN